MQDIRDLEDLQEYIIEDIDHFIGRLRIVETDTKNEYDEMIIKLPNDKRFDIIHKDGEMLSNTIKTVTRQQKSMIDCQLSE